MGFVLVSDSACVIAFLSLAGYLVRTGALQGPAPGRFFLLGCGVTAAWALVRSLAAAEFSGLGAAPHILEILRNCTWLLFLLSLLRHSIGSDNAVQLARRVLFYAAPVAVVFVAFDAFWLLFLADSAGVPVWRFGLFGRLVFAVIGLALIENLSRNAPFESFWSIKFLCFGLGGIFAYDFFAYADAILFGQIDPDLIAAQGAVVLITSPLLALAAHRKASWQPGLAISRRFVFRTAAVLGAGVYLVVMGAVGYYLRQFGGNWGGVLQAAFLFAALLLLAAAVSSGSFRGYARVFLAKHLFAYKYDYREEWLRFINTIGREETGRNLRERVIKAVADIVDSPAGALWQWQDVEQRYSISARWNYEHAKADEPVDGSLARFLVSQDWIIRLDEVAKNPELYPQLTLPRWLAHFKGAWLIVPLLHHERLSGFILVQQPRAPQALNWEDYDLLKTVGRQAASYLAEHEATQALADARQIDLFNKRFAFVIHDIKTVISQMSLLLSNADKHRDNPEFQKDLLISVQESVESMKRLLPQIQAERRKDLEASVIDIVPLVRNLVARRNSLKPPIELESELDVANIVADENRITTIVGHLIQNASEAAGESGTVCVRVFQEGDAATIAVEDDGPGMDAAFIRDNLFRPLTSTKSTGYGIGAYQCRELVRELKGHLHVSSVPGEGTTMRVSFPVVGRAASLVRREVAAS